MELEFLRRPRHLPHARKRTGPATAGTRPVGLVRLGPAAYLVIDAGTGLREPGRADHGRKPATGRSASTSC